MRNLLVNGGESAPSRLSRSALCWPMCRLSGLRDLAAESPQGDCVRVRAAATAGVQVVDRGHLGGRQLEVEHVDVLCNAAGLGGLRNDRAAMLQTPAQHHLG